MGVVVPVEEPHLVAIREEDERNLELLRVVALLVLLGDWVDARPLRFGHRHWPLGAVAEPVVLVRRPGGDRDVHSVGAPSSSGGKEASRCGSRSTR